MKKIVGLGYMGVALYTSAWACMLVFKRLVLLKEMVKDGDPFVGFNKRQRASSSSAFRL